MNNKDKINLRKLRSVTNEIELGMIKEILEDNNIPYILKDKGSGAYMRIITGSSPFSTEIMVEESEFDKANKILETISI